jgi:hypothetical protein
VIKLNVFARPKSAGTEFGSSFTACLKYLAAFTFSPVFAKRVARWMHEPKCS